MIRMVCLTPDEMTDYLLGRLPEEQSVSIEEHLSSCDRCEESVRNLDTSEDSLIRHLRLSPDPPGQDSEWESCLDSLRELPDRATSDSQGSGDSKASESVPLEQMLRPESVYHYQLEGQLGRGGMGVVYRSWHPQLHRPVAIKLLAASRSADAGSIARFQREMRAAGGLDHQGIVRAVDAGVWQGTYFMVMELIDGVDLSRIARRCGPLGVADACEMVVQAAEAVQFAHEHQIIHRDIKPSNLMLTREGTVKILDFGLARLEHGGLTSHDATTAGRLIGTLDYLAPEQAAGDTPIDSRSDVYGLGATLFRLLSGRAPHGSSQDRPILQFLQELTNEDAPSLDHYREDLPRELCEVVSTALSRDPSQRPASAKELVDLLRPWAHGAQLATVCRDSIDDDEPNDSSPGIVSTRTLFSDRDSDRRATALVDTQAKPARARSIPYWLIATGFLLIGLVGGWQGVTFWLKSGDAFIRIESEVDQVTLELIKDGEVSAQIEIHPGEKVSRVQVGTYELKIPQKSDSVRLDQNSLVLMRGDERIVRITKQDDPQNAPGMPSAAEPVEPDQKVASVADIEKWLQHESTKVDLLRDKHGPDHPIVRLAKDEYVQAKKELIRIATGDDPMAQTSKGRTYKQWTDIVLRETDPSTVVDAISALSSLSTTATQHEQTMLTLIKIARWNEERGPDDLATAYVSYLSNKKIDPQRQPRTPNGGQTQQQDYNWEQLFPRVEEDWHAVVDAILTAFTKLPSVPRNRAHFSIAAQDETTKRITILDAARSKIVTAQVVVESLCQKDQQDDTRALANYVWLAKFKQEPTDQQRRALAEGTVKLKKVILATMLNQKQYKFGREMGIAAGELLSDETSGLGGPIRDLAQRSITEWEKFEGTEEHRFLRSTAAEIVLRWENRSGGLRGSLEGCEFIRMFAAANLIDQRDRDAASTFLHDHLTKQLLARQKIDDPSSFDDSTMWIIYLVQALANVDGKLPDELEQYAMKEGSKQATLFAAWEQGFREGTADDRRDFGGWLVQFPLETTRVLFDVAAQEMKARSADRSSAARFVQAYARSRSENEYLRQVGLSITMPYALRHLDDADIQMVFGTLLATRMNDGLDQIRLDVPLDKYADALLDAGRGENIGSARGLALRLAQVGGADPAEVEQLAIERIFKKNEGDEKRKWAATSNEFSWLLECLSHCDPNTLTDEQFLSINDRIAETSFSPYSGNPSDMQRTVIASLRLCARGSAPDRRIVLASLGVRSKEFRSSWNPSGRTRQFTPDSEAMAWSRISGGVPVDVVKQVLDTLAENPISDDEVLGELLSKQRRLIQARESEKESTKKLEAAISAVRTAIEAGE